MYIAKISNCKQFHYIYIQVLNIFAHIHVCVNMHARAIAIANIYMCWIVALVYEETLQLLVILPRIVLFVF